MTVVWVNLAILLGPCVSTTPYLYPAQMISLVCLPQKIARALWSQLPLLKKNTIFYLFEFYKFSWIDSSEIITHSSALLTCCRVLKFWTRVVTLRPSATLNMLVSTTASIFVMAPTFSVRSFFFVGDCRNNKSCNYDRILYEWNKNNNKIIQIEWMY